MELDEIPRTVATQRGPRSEVPNTPREMPEFAKNYESLDIEPVIIENEPDELEIILETVRENKPRTAAVKKHARAQSASAQVRGINNFLNVQPDKNDEEKDVTSHLTEGVFSGNPLKAMRHKRKKDFTTEDK